VLGVGAVECDLPLGSDLFGGAEVHRGGGVHPDPGVAVFVVVGGEETVTEHAGVFQGAEPGGEIGHVFEGFELGFGVG
jgi:hypothetical protein